MIVTSLLKGKTVSESDKKSKLILVKSLSKVSAGNSKDKEDTIRWLYHDLKSQVAIGDLNAKLS